MEKNGGYRDVTRHGCFNCGRVADRGRSLAGLMWGVTLLFVQMLMLPGALALDKGGEVKPTDKGTGYKTKSASAMEGPKKAGESLEKEEFVYLIQNDGKNQVTKVKWREGLTVGQVHLEHHTYGWRLVIELWRGDQRTTYKAGRLLPVFDHRLVDRDVMIIGPVDAERRAAIEALPEIKALNLPRDKRKHWDGRF